MLVRLITCIPRRQSAGGYVPSLYNEMCVTWAISRAQAPAAVRWRAGGDLMGVGGRMHLVIGKQSEEGVEAHDIWSPSRGSGPAWYRQQDAAQVCCSCCTGLQSAGRLM
jgi:hypothetical protein